MDVHGLLEYVMNWRNEEDDMACGSEDWHHIHRKIYDDDLV